MTITQLQQGLSAAEAQKRLAQYGPNALPEQPPKPLWRRFLRQFQSPLIYILLFALAVDLVIWIGAGAPGVPIESLAIALILLLNAGLGVYQESKAETALARLKALAAAQVWVMRDGQLTQLPSTALVPGDVIRLEAGDRIPADGVWRGGQGLLVDEAVLTGESLPVDKELASETFSGTLLVRGKGYLEIARTGAASAMGRLAAMLGNIEAEKTPLEKRIFEPTQLSSERREALTDRFEALAPDDQRSYEIRFRASKIGPNALALPGGVIYVTDALVELAPDNEAVLGVLAHELGHIDRRHLMRRLFASAAVGAAAAVLFGDVSTVLAALPAILIELDYSRSMEREADLYAVELLRANGISTGSLATLFERMQKAHDKRGSSSDWPAYLSTHPPTPERVELFRKSLN